MSACRLEYKYQQLKQSAKDGDELPAPETCVQESEDEDEVVYRKGIKTERKLLKKLKGITGKGKVRFSSSTCWKDFNIKCGMHVGSL